VWHHDVIVRTTVNINDTALRELKGLPQRSGLSFLATPERVLALGIAHSRADALQARVRIKPSRLVLYPFLCDVSPNHVYDRIEAETGMGRP